MNDVPTSQDSSSTVAVAVFGDEPATGYWRVWLLMILPPILLTTISFGYAVIAVTMAKGDTSVIGQAVAKAVPYIIVVNHSLLLCLTIWFMKLDKITFRRIGWPAQWRWSSELRVELLIGILAGFVLFAIHQYLSGPFVKWLAEGSSGFRLATGSDPLGSNKLIALALGIVFGGFVEEQLYRGYVLVRLTERMPLTIAIIPMLLSFGLLHFGLGWTGVFVATLTGLTLTLLFVWRRSLVSVVLAHAMINVLVLTI
jgi:membrane protease YdiL (CAAX protease family)